MNMTSFTLPRLCFTGSGETSTSARPEKRKRDDGDRDVFFDSSGTSSSGGSSDRFSPGESSSRISGGLHDGSSGDGIEEPAAKKTRIEISLSGIRKAIRKTLPKELHNLCIPGAELLQDVFDLIDQPGENVTFSRNLRNSKLDLLRRYNWDKKGKNENDRFLLKSLLEGYHLPFKYLLRTEETPDLDTLFEASAINRDEIAVEHLTHKARQVKQEASPSTLQFFADCGELALLRKLLSISTLNGERKKELWKTAVRQRHEIQRLNRLTEERRGVAFDEIVESPVGTPETETLKTRAALALLFTRLEPGDPNFQGKALGSAIRNGHTVIGKALIYQMIRQRINVNFPHHCFDRTVLHEAVYHQNPELTRLLLNVGADVSVRTTLGRTPLHYAAIKNNSDLSRILLDAKADVNVRDNEGITPLHYAAAQGTPELGRMLIAAGANINATTHNGETPLHYAATKGFKQEWMERNPNEPGGAIVFPRDPEETDRREAFAKMLLQQDADPTMVADNGDTPLATARRERNERLVRLFTRSAT